MKNNSKRTIKAFSECSLKLFFAMHEDKYVTTSQAEEEDKIYDAKVRSFAFIFIYIKNQTQRYIYVLA